MDNTKRLTETYGEPDDGFYTIYIAVVKLAILFYAIYCSIYFYFKEEIMTYICFISFVANVAMFHMKKKYYPYFILIEHILVCVLSYFAMVRLGWNSGVQYLLLMAVSLGFFSPFKNTFSIVIVNVFESLLLVYLFVNFYNKPIQLSPSVAFIIPYIHTLSSFTCLLCVIVGTRLSDVSYAFKNLKMNDENKRLFALANQDGLTRLYNRRFMEQLIEEVWQNNSENKGKFWLVLCDIDYFKEINDYAGHDAGDNTLIAIANTLTTMFKRNSYISRWGGDEFMILINDEVDRNTLKAMLNQLLLAVYDIDYDKLQLRVPISLTIGAAYTVGKSSIRHLIDTTDKLLYEGKEKGRNVVVIVEK